MGGHDYWTGKSWAWEGQGAGKPMAWEGWEAGKPMACKLGHRQTSIFTFATKAASSVAGVAVFFPAGPILLLLDKFWRMLLQKPINSSPVPRWSLHHHRPDGIVGKPSARRLKTLVQWLACLNFGIWIALFSAAFCAPTTVSFYPQFLRQWAVLLLMWRLRLCCHRWSLASSVLLLKVKLVTAVCLMSQSTLWMSWATYGLWTRRAKHGLKDWISAYWDIFVWIWQLSCMQTSFFCSSLIRLCSLIWSIACFLLAGLNMILFPWPSPPKFDCFLVLQESFQKRRTSWSLSMLATEWIRKVPWNYKLVWHVLRYSMLHLIFDLSLCDSLLTYHQGLCLPCIDCCHIWCSVRLAVPSMHIVVRPCTIGQWNEWQQWCFGQKQQLDSCCGAGAQKAAHLNLSGAWMGGMRCERIMKLVKAGILITNIPED